MNNDGVSGTPLAGRRFSASYQPAVRGRGKRQWRSMVDTELLEAVKDAVAGSGLTSREIAERSGLLMRQVKIARERGRAMKWSVAVRLLLAVVSAEHGARARQQAAKILGIDGMVHSP